MAKLIIQSIQVDSSLNKPEINEYGLSIGNKSIDGVISLSFQSSGNFDEYLNKDDSINKKMLLDKIYLALEKAGINLIIDL